MPDLPTGDVAAGSTPAPPAPERERAARDGALGERVSAFLDGTLDVAVASFAVWTLLHAAMLLGLPLPGAAVVWVVTTGAVIAVRVRRPFLTLDVPMAPPWAALALAVAAAALASVVVRVDADDAWYMVQATWVAERGELPMRDILFTHGEWPRTVGNTPALGSIESWYGTVARFTGLPAGDVAYRYFTPLAAFAAAWALWLLLRSWRARRPTASLTVALLVVVLGGYAHTTFGNMHLARIWQGKAVLLAVLVPYLYAVLATVLRRDRAGGRPPWTALGAVTAGGIAAVGLSSTGIFLVPLVAATAGVVLLWRRDWPGLAVAGAALAGPLAGGLATFLAAPNAYGGGRGFSDAYYGMGPWATVLQDGRVAAAAVAVGVVVALGVVVPRGWRTVDARVQGPLLAVVVCGVLFTIEPLYTVFVTLMGSEAVAFRLTWVVPLPAVIGLVASLPARRLGVPVVPVAVAVVGLLVAAGVPLWDSSNRAFLGRPGSWKVRAPEDLMVARWVVEQGPEGRYLAANWLTFNVGTLSTAPRPVGTRLDYVASLVHLPGGQVEERRLLQQIADGGSRLPENRVTALEALDALDVTLACVAWNDEFTGELFDAAGFRRELSLGPWTCWER